MPLETRESRCGADTNGSSESPMPDSDRLDQVISAPLTNAGILE